MKLRIYKHFNQRGICINRTKVELKFLINFSVGAFHHCINRTKVELKHVLFESAAGVQQIARASEDLNQLTENLQRLISQFKINDQQTYSVASNGKVVGMLN